MDFKVRKFKYQDKFEVLQMMEAFYASEAVSTNGSKEIFENDFENCVNENPFLDGYVLYSDTDILGYAMFAKSFSTEFGKMCIWIEDLYLKKEYRGQNIIPRFFEYTKSVYPNVLFKLEVENENTHALHVYKKLGFKNLPYSEMIYFS